MGELLKRKKISALKKIATQVTRGADALQEDVSVASYGPENYKKAHTKPAMTNRVIVGSNGPTNYEEAARQQIKNFKAARKGSRDIKVDKKNKSTKLPKA